jgi:ABC-type multidrug transport system fused ATPase/permease subunit
VEQGNHEQLIQRNGAYVKLWKVQAGLRSDERLQL